MKKRIRILTLALAFSLMTSQAAQAALISPLSVGQTGGPGVTENQQPSNAQTGGQTGNASGFPGNQQVALEGPGYNGGTSSQQGTSGVTNGQPAAGTGTQTGTGIGTQTGMNAGMGAGIQPGTGTGTQTGTNIGMGAGVQTGTGVQEPGMSAGGGTQIGTGTGTQTAAVQKPEISAEAGVLYDATHNVFLFEKNADEKLYPASITKLMTALLVMEHGNLNDTVTFSKAATTNLESGAVTLSLTEGDKVSVKDCMYGLLLKSANEVANGLAEYVSGSVSAFADLMNQKAAALGCTNTHFVNPNGLNDPDHYSTCRDMAKIAKAAFENPTIREISSTLSYTFPATKKAAARTITPGHKMLYPTDSRYYSGILGGKTGYTSLAGNTLVTCVEQNGVRLIAVVMKASGTHYTDTKAMLDYGYALAAAGQLNGQAGSQVSGQTGTQTSAAQTGWIEDGSVWRYRQADGSYLASGLYEIGGVVYGFNDSGVMATGWQKFGGEWRYFKSSGAMAVSCWQQDAGKWFYLGTDGKIVKNALIDNQYYVGADGVWVQ